MELSIEEPAGFGAPLEKFLICNNGGHRRGELAALVELAFAGAEPTTTLELRTVANPEIRLQGRVTICGPPRGALLILTALAAKATASPNGRPATNGVLIGVGGPESGA